MRKETTLNTVDILTKNVKPFAAIEASIGDVKVVFSKEFTIKNINTFKTAIGNMTDEDIKYVYKVSREKISAKLDDLRRILDILDLEKVIECLPKLKNGHIRNTSMPVYMTGITSYEGDSGWCRISSIELSIMPLEKRDTFIVDFNTDRQYDKKDKAIFDGESYNVLSYERNSFIDPKDLVPGRIYSNAKDKEFFYIGTMSYEGENQYRSGELEYKYAKITNVFIKLNKKLKASLTKVTSFEDWWKNETTKSIKENGYFSSESCNMYNSASTKMTTEVETVFNDMVTEFTTEGITFKTYGIGSKHCYILCDDSDCFNRIPISVYNDSKDATNALNKLKKSNPNIKKLDHLVCEDIVITDGVCDKIMYETILECIQPDCAIFSKNDN